MGKKNKIFLVTSNKNKVREFEEILGFKLSHIDLELDEIQEIDVEKVVRHKAEQAFLKIKKPVIVEDTGLYLKEWNGLPGALVKLFGQTIGYKNLCKLIKKNRQAKAQTVIGYFDGKKYKSFVGEILGNISLVAKGKTNFGWDPIFIPKGKKKTFAEVSNEEKNKISMRKIALSKFKKFYNYGRKYN